MLLAPNNARKLCLFIQLDGLDTSPAQIAETHNG
jgi:hypothetical protein